MHAQKVRFQNFLERRVKRTGSGGQSHGIDLRARFFHWPRTEPLSLTNQGQTSPTTEESARTRAEPPRFHWRSSPTVLDVSCRLGARSCGIAVQVFKYLSVDVVFVVVDVVVVVRVRGLTMSSRRGSRVRCRRTRTRTRPPCSPPASAAGERALPRTVPVPLPVPWHRGGTVVAPSSPLLSPTAVRRRAAGLPPCPSLPAEQRVPRQWSGERGNRVRIPAQPGRASSFYFRAVSIRHTGGLRGLSTGGSE